MTSEPYSAATITLRVFPGSVFTEEVSQAVITESYHVNRLARCFAGLGTGASSPVGGGWYPAAVITFSKTDGTELTVLIHPQLKYWNEWNEGRGDWPLPPEFMKILAETLKAGRNRS